MTRFLHITDLHITAPETEDPTWQTDTVATLDRVLEMSTQLTPQPEFIVVSGDLTNIADVPSYNLIADRLSRCDLPVIMTIGNHDSRAAWHTAFPGHPAAPDGYVDQHAALSGVHVIALDSSVPGAVSGALDQTQLGHAEQMLGDHPDLPKVIAVHHPPRLDPRGGRRLGYTG